MKKMILLIAFVAMFLTRGAVAETVELKPIVVLYQEAEEEQSHTVVTDPVKQVENQVVMQETVNGFKQPIIHGLMGDSIYLSLDGIKYSNSLFRSGPNQYYSWIPDEFVSKATLNSRLSDISSGALGGSIDRTLGVRESKVKLDTNFRDHKEMVSYLGKNFSFSVVNDDRQNVKTPNGEVPHSSYNQKGAMLIYEQDNGDVTKFVHTQSDDIDRTDKFEKGDYYVYELQQYDFLYHKFNVNDNFVIIPSYQRMEEKINRNSPEKKNVHSTSNIFGLQLAGRFDFADNEYRYITYGLSDTYEDIEYKKGLNTNNYKYNTFSAYFTYNDSIGDNFLYSILYKFSCMDVSGSGLSRSLSNDAFGFRGEYFVNDDTILFANLSLNYKFPTITNLAEAREDSVTEIANPNLKQEKAYTIELGYDYNGLVITGFYKKLYDMIIREQTNILDENGEYKWQYQNANSGHIKGINVKYENKYKNGLGVYLFAEYVEGKTDYDYLSKLTPFKTEMKLSQDFNFFGSDQVYMTWQYAPKVPEDKMAAKDKKDIRIKDHNYGYNIVNLGYLVELAKSQEVRVEFDNIFNDTGRVYGSSTDFTERNVKISYTYKFGFTKHRLLCFEKGMIAFSFYIDF